MNGVSKSKEETGKEKGNKTELTVQRLLNIFNHSDVTLVEVPEVVSLFLYSIGSSLLEDPPNTNEEALKRYAESPTLGSALMAQAVHMKETWTRKETKER